MSASLPSRSPRLPTPSLSSGIERAFIDEQVPELLGEEVCLLHPRLGYDSGPGGGDFDFAVREIDLQWPLRATGVRVCQCIRHSPGGWYWVVETPDDVFAIDALDDPHGIGQLNFPTGLAFEADDGEIAATRAAFVTMKRLVKRMRGRAKWDPIIAMAATDPRSYAKCLDACLGSRLGQRVSRSVLAGRMPDDEVWRRSFLPLRLRRIRTPQRAAIAPPPLDGTSRGQIRTPHRPARRRRGARRGGQVSARLVSHGPLRRVLLEVSPHPLEALAAATPRRLRWWAPDMTPETPHRSTPHGRMTSIAVLLYYWVDFLLGTWLKLNPLACEECSDRRREGMVGHPGRPTAISSASSRRVSPPMLGRLLPNPDLTLVLDAPAAALAQRKQELPETELDASAHLWSELARTGSGFLLAG